jgi:cyclase
LKNGVLVKSKEFNFHQLTGDPIGQVERFTDWKADELIYIDISREGSHAKSESMSVIGSATSSKDEELEETTDFYSIIKKVSSKCMIPLTAGGKIKTLQDISELLKNGADKVCINTKAIEDPSFIEKASKKFGSQCIVVSIDVKRDKKTGQVEVYKNFGKDKTGLDPVKWSLEVEKRGAGEILLGSIDRDGLGTGYDLDLIKSVTEKVKIPVIALGGVGKFEDFVIGLETGKASAVAAANIFHFTELSVINAKKYLKSRGIDVRL